MIWKFDLHFMGQSPVPDILIYVGKYYDTSKYAKKSGGHRAFLGDMGYFILPTLRVFPSFLRENKSFLTFWVRKLIK